VKKRKTFGLLINDIDGSFQTLLWLAFKQAAEKMDCNLMVFVGRALKNEGIGANQHHIIYCFIEKGVLDGLIIASSAIATFIKPSEFKRFCKKYRDIPIVSFGIEIPNASTIICEGEKGLKDLIQHLIDDHGYKKIAFVKGPEDNGGAIGRFVAYKEILEEKNIPFDEKLIFKGDFVTDSGYRAMEEIVQSGIEYDAVVFANDSMAYGGIRSVENMKKLGIYPLDKDCVICGFDDSVIARRVNPPLTTVKQPMTEMCDKCVELLLKGDVEEKLYVFDSVLVKRASCGCSYNVENDDSFNNKVIKLVGNYRIHENIQTYEMDDLFNKLTPVLKQCFIGSCFIFKYVDGPVFFEEDMAYDEFYKVPLKSEMVYAYYNYERICIDEKNKIIKTTDILPKCFMPVDKRITYIVMPLFFSNEHFGYICFETTDNNVMIYELLRGEISNTLKGALTVLERESMEETLRENERLASLGHMIGGISHNLMTPIMSIAGVSVALIDLKDEYKDSINDKLVTTEDHYEISSEIEGWIKKLKEYNSYMSNVITKVRYQAVQFNTHDNENFTIEELVNRIEFLKSSNKSIKNANLEVYINSELKKAVIVGDISNMVQVVENLIENAFESYSNEKSCECRVKMSINRNENKIVISVEDFGSGITDDVRDRIFKYMVTTKGKNGTGLSLLLSYSTIKGKFDGEIWFESKVNQGTTFYIAIPVS